MILDMRHIEYATACCDDSMSEQNIVRQQVLLKAARRAIYLALLEVESAISNNSKVLKGENQEKANAHADA